MSNYHIKADKRATSAVASYLEYTRIVRSDDKGVTFSEEQYEAYKERIIPIRIKNRLYVCWTNETGMDCKLIGPETQCFCNHRYHQHMTDIAELPEERPVPQPCQVPGCTCASYRYTPMIGHKFVFCGCRHTPKDHSPAPPFKCQKSDCPCECFSTKFVCGCGSSAATHRTLTETRAERVSRGHPVGRDTPYKAMGGVTGFSSLMDGYLRLDPSGKGASGCDERPTTASNNIRENNNDIHPVKSSNGASSTEDDLAVCASTAKKPTETDMEFYERRYKEKTQQDLTCVQKLAALPASSPTLSGGATSQVESTVQDLSVRGSTFQDSAVGASSDGSENEDQQRM